ncbi:hypothetical protein AB0I00_31005 [Streptomyces sp. NPDC050803]|uniref:hypothetical protein n=1 Tax=unclassified Streptomyces TaxID=2593676 RepID=UPI00341ACA04
MVSITHTHVRTDKRRCSTPEAVSVGSADQLAPQDAGSPENRDWPTDTQVWNWAAGAVLSGYGPPGSSLL